MTQERLKEITEIVFGQEYIPHNEAEVTDDLLAEKALCKDRIDYLTADLEFYKTQLKRVNELLEEIEND